MQVTILLLLISQITSVKWLLTITQKPLIFWTTVNIPVSLYGFLCVRLKTESELLFTDQQLGTDVEERKRFVQIYLSNSGTEHFKSPSLPPSLSLSLSPCALYEGCLSVVYVKVYVCIACLLYMMGGIGDYSDYVA